MVRALGPRTNAGPFIKSEPALLRLLLGTLSLSRHQILSTRFILTAHPISSNSHDPRKPKHRHRHKGDQHQDRQHYRKQWYAVFQDRPHRFLCDGLRDQKV